jgi:membrane-associated phospholipid phosphatase
MLRSTRIRIKKLIAAIGLLSAELAIVLVAFILAIILFSFLVKQIFIDKQEQFDHNVFQWLEDHVNPFNTAFMQAVTFLGTHTFLIPANLLLTCYFLFIRRHKWYSIKVAAIALSSTAMMFLLKNIFSRQRPLAPLLKPALGYSFPSGHSLMSFAFYGLLIYLSYKYIENLFVRWLLILLLGSLILLIGLSRIYLRVHYASDVLAGFSMGIAWLVFSIWTLNRMEKYGKKKIEPVVEEKAVPETV